MAEFATRKIGEHAYLINDMGQSSFYLLEGEERTAVIDTGITPNETILPHIRTLTDKPLVLLITHAHVDHFHHMDEFETCYMSHREFEMGPELLRGMMAGKALNLEDTIDIRTDSVIDLGGQTIEVCEVPGHTPGSVVFWNPQQDLLFTGDAIGSGYGVWMQVPGAVPLREYETSLRKLLAWLVSRGGTMKFYGGHHYQQFLSRAVPGFNPLNMGLLADLIDLVHMLRTGEIVGSFSDVQKTFTPDPIYYAKFGRAEIQYLTVE